ncbi:DUF1501 domain-containing protein [Persicobacter diffluens]|uniref:DUF1501 domain-containing protein n=1 Tax=Persicobacter diffluens TaxID=981 RepID=A0AAN5AM87_9BACT|nr:hypothetical protein PEDI_41190 [Persicobacter diffluens]
MKRRDFIKTSGLVSAMGLLPGFLHPLKTLAAGSIQKRLVVVQLSGGNDGLNTIVPFRNDIYYRERPVIGLKGEQLIKVSDELAFNAAAKGMVELMDKGWLTVVNGVGYPNPNRSHFRSLDIWQSAAAADQYLPTGWLGRYLDSSCGKQSQVIQTGGGLDLAMKGEERKGLAIEQLRQFNEAWGRPLQKRLYQQLQEEHLGEDNLGYLYKTFADTMSSHEYINERLSQKVQGSDFGNSDLGRQLALIGKMMQAEIDAPVYYASTSGFDTHAGQQKTQERLWKQTSQALLEFSEYLNKSNLLENTLIMVFSEFGRRVSQNASQGTDHGTAGNLYLISKNLPQAGFYNELPSLTDLDANGDLKYSVDFRSVYRSVLEDWLKSQDQVIKDAKVKRLKNLIV